MKNNLTKIELEKIVSESLSIADICRKLNIRPIGGNYKTIKFKLNLWNIDTSHFTGSAWNVGTRYKNIKKKIPLNEILIENSTYLSTRSLKNRLINEGLKEYKCEKCGIHEWNNEKIVLDLHHINLNNLDNRIENLILLCPNCHSLEHKHNKKNISSINEFRKLNINHPQPKKDNLIKINKEKKYKNICKVCDSPTNRMTFCSNECRFKFLSKNIPNKDDLKLKINECKSICEVGRFYNVSDNAIRKWMKKYNIVK